MPIKYKPCVASFATQDDRMNEPPPQPRVRKVTTVINTLGVIVRKTPTEIGVWVLTACVEKSFPITDQHIFMNFDLGTWIIVGIYPDGTIASFSPWSLILKAYETTHFNGCVCIKQLASELIHEKTVFYSEICDFAHNNPYDRRSYYERELTAEIYMISGFGRILGRSTWRMYLENHREKTFFYAMYCGGQINGCSWLILSFEPESQPDEGFSDRELSSIADFRTKHKDNTIAPTPIQCVARHIGLVTDVQKYTMQCWSQHVSLEADHLTKIQQPPKSKEIEGTTIQPFIGQWIQFDVGSNDMLKITNTSIGHRFSIPEYLPINSPGGIGVFHTNKTVRMMLSCILVKGTDHPRIFELPTFGLVMTIKESLVSGKHMQLLLEKTSTKVRRSSGVCWLVIDSTVVNINDVTIEKIKHLDMETIRIKDAMETSHLVPTDKSTSTVSTSILSGITTFKYQQQQNSIYNHEPRRDYYPGNSVQINTNYASRNGRFQTKNRKLSSYTGECMEGHGLVEKIMMSYNTGILWLFEYNSSVHFQYNDFDLKVGDYAYVKLVQKEDSSVRNGFRWMYISGTKKQAPFYCYTVSNNLHVEDQLTYKGKDSHSREIFNSKFFPSIMDIDLKIKNPLAGKVYNATVFRKKVLPTPTESKPRFWWTIYEARINSNSEFFSTQTLYTRPVTTSKNTLHSFSPMTETVTRTASQDSIASQPLQSLAPKT